MVISCQLMPADEKEPCMLTPDTYLVKMVNAICCPAILPQMLLLLNSPWFL